MIICLWTEVKNQLFKLRLNIVTEIKLNIVNKSQLVKQRMLLFVPVIHQLKFDIV